MNWADTMLHHMTVQRQPSEDEEADLRNPDNWDWDAAVWNWPSPRPAITVSVRLERENARLLGAAARKAEMPVSRYLLQAALEAARRDLG